MKTYENIIYEAIIFRIVSRFSKQNMSIDAKCLKTLSGLFFPNLINQLSCRILTKHDNTRPILHDDWSIKLGENRPDGILKHLAVMLNINSPEIL